MFCPQKQGSAQDHILSEASRVAQHPNTSLTREEQGYGKPSGFWVKGTRGKGRGTGLAKIQELQPLPLTFHILKGFFKGQAQGNLANFALIFVTLAVIFCKSCVLMVVYNVEESNSLPHSNINHRGGQGVHMEDSLVKCQAFTVAMKMVRQ